MPTRKGRAAARRAPTSPATGGRAPSILHEIARLAAEDLDLRPMLQRIAEALAARFGFELVALVRIDRDPPRFVCEAAVSSLPTEVRPGYTRPLGSGVVGEVAATGEPLLLDDVRTFPNYVETLPGARSELCVPVLHRGRVVALLNLESRRPAAFRGKLRLFTAVADQIAGAIASARLFEEIRRRAFFLEVLSEVSRTALETGELEQVLGRIVRYLRAKFDLALVAIVVADEKGEEWLHRAIATRGDVVPPRRRRWPVSAGVVGRAIRSGEPQRVLDVGADPDYFGLDPRVVAEYVVPIRLQGRILGALNLEADAPEVFAGEDLPLFRTLAEQVAGPIELALVNRKLSEANAELARLSRHDALTGVANRRSFDEALELEWRRAERGRSGVALVLADVDRFKAYNDTLGHPAGDAALARVAATFAAVAHRAGDLVARYGGEEFAILLPGVDLERAAALAEAMRRRLAEVALPHPAAPPPGRVSASFGVAALGPRRGLQPAALVEAADAALYRAKAGGRDRVEVAAGEAPRKRPARRARPGRSSPGS